MQFAVISLRDKDLDFGKSAGRLKEECGSRMIREQNFELFCFVQPVFYSQAKNNFAVTKFIYKNILWRMNQIFRRYFCGAEQNICQNSHFLAKLVPDILHIKDSRQSLYHFLAQYKEAYKQYIVNIIATEPPFFYLFNQFWN